MMVSTVSSQPTSFSVFKLLFGLAPMSVSRLQSPEEVGLVDGITLLRFYFLGTP